jgi:hypothetical protein
MTDQKTRPAILISRVLPEEATELARARADVEGRVPPTSVNPEVLGAR